MENTAGRAFNAWPERLYVLSREGTVLYKGGKGPYDFNPDELERFLAERLSAISATPTLTSSLRSQPLRLKV